MTVRADMTISLDGFATTTGGTQDNPMGQDWPRLMASYMATHTFRERVFGDTTGEGTRGVDNQYAERYFANIGAEIMGAGKFGLHLHPNDPEWLGWWGANPPFHCPVYVLTHEKRESLVMEGGTVFHFVSAPPAEVLAMATADSGQHDVRIGGGPTMLAEYLTADLVDVLHLSVVPIVLGGGIRLLDGVRGLEHTHSAISEVAESGTIHITFTRIE